MKYLSWFRYCNEVFIINQWRGVDDIKVNLGTSIPQTHCLSQSCEVLANGTEVCQYITGESVIVDQMGFDLVSMFCKSIAIYICFISGQL